MNKDEDVATLIRSIERIFGINESDPKEDFKFKVFRREMEVGFKIEVLK